jgi:transposase-like protein
MAQRYGVNANLLVNWRRQTGEALRASADGATPFAFELKDSDPL